MTDLDRIDHLRLAALAAAAGNARKGTRPEEVARAAVLYATALINPAGLIVVPRPRITDQVTGNTLPPRKGHTMPAVMTDGQIAHYAAPTEKDFKGFPVPENVTLTDDGDGVFLTRTDNEDGSTDYFGNGPGTLTLTWSDGDLSKVDTLLVTTSAASEIDVPDPVITDQAATV